MKKIVLITGAAGFIGSNLAKNILQKDSVVQVIGIDNLNDYYDVSLKEYRLKELNCSDHFSFYSGGDFSGVGTGDCSKPGSSGRGSLFDYKSGCLY